MPTRRVLLSAAAAAAVCRADAAPRSFSAFLAGVRAEAARAGVRPAILQAALGGLRPLPRVLELDRKQPEFTLTWAQYRGKVIPPARIAAAARARAANRGLLDEIGARYGVDPGVIVGIWGLESGFGANLGGFNVVASLATLAFDGRRAAFFRAELLNALRILNEGDIPPARMLGSWAGAMGQPQFMPSAYLRFAVDYDGDRRRDIWGSRPDIFASVANYLAKSGWRAGEPWGQPVRVPAGYAGPTGRDHRQPLGAWMAAGVRRADGGRFSRDDVPAALLLPDGPGAEAYLVYANFAAIRRYNPSDFYALAVGLLGYGAA